MISKYEISNAKKDAADAEEAQAYLQQVISDNIGLTERNKTLESNLLKDDYIVKDLVVENLKLTNENKRLTNEVAALKHALKEWQNVQEGKS